MHFVDHEKPNPVVISSEDHGTGQMFIEWEGSTMWQALINADVKTFYVSCRPVFWYFGWYDCDYFDSLLLITPGQRFYRFKT